MGWFSGSRLSPSFAYLIVGERTTRLGVALDLQSDPYPYWLDILKYKIPHELFADALPCPQATHSVRSYFRLTGRGGQL